MHKQLPDYFSLDLKAQYELIRKYGEKSSRDLKIIEKDIWVCWVLKQLFEMPESSRLEMAFKGGTSLSKVYNVIDRFSEDVDITLDYRQFPEVQELGLDDGQTAPASIGSAVRRRIDKALKARVKAFSNDVVAPYLRTKLEEVLQGVTCVVECASDESVDLHYQSVIPDISGEYIRSKILIEFGGRNIINPNQVFNVKPYIAEEFSDLATFSSSNVVVLNAGRTFWEKATMMHVECHRGVRTNAERISRHWYDLDALMQHKTGRDACIDVLLMRDVIALKNIFFNSSFANYQLCLTGDFQLLPDSTGLEQLKYDYNQMLESAMLRQDSISFDKLVESIRSIEVKINQAIKDFSETQ